MLGPEAQAVRCKAGDDVPVEVVDHLACSSAVVLQDIDTSAACDLLESLAYALHGLDDILAYGRISVKDVFTVLLGDDEGVPLVDGIEVQEGVEVLRFVDLGRGKLALDNHAENAVVLFGHGILAQAWLRFWGRYAEKCYILCAPLPMGALS